MIVNCFNKCIFDKKMIENRLKRMNKESFGCDIRCSYIGANMYRKLNTKSTLAAAAVSASIEASNSPTTSVSKNYTKTSDFSSLMSKGFSNSFNNINSLNERLSSHVSNGLTFNNNVENVKIGKINEANNMKSFNILNNINPFGPFLLTTGKMSNLDDEYDVLNEIGSGKYGIVKKVIHKRKMKEYAVKIINKRQSSVISCYDMLANEINILTKLNHFNIMKLVDIIENRSYIYLITELYNGGELYNLINKHSCFNELFAADLMKQLFDSLHYLHQNGIIHRDIKPENLIFASNDIDVNVGMNDLCKNNHRHINYNKNRLVLVDFGLSVTFNPHSPTKQYFRAQCGSPCYVSPDVLKKCYDEKTDLWSAGVILYMLLSGKSPFCGVNDEETIYNISTGKYDMNSLCWDNISSSAKDLVCNLLQMDPTKRFSAKQALDSEWIQAYTR